MRNSEISSSFTGRVGEEEDDDDADAYDDAIVVRATVDDIDLSIVTSEITREDAGGYQSASFDDECECE